MPSQRSAAAPLAAIYALLIAYASLYSSSDWRDQGLWPWAFVTAPWPRYWSAFDIWINLAGYAPLGFLLALGWLRSSQATGRKSWALVVATLAASILSFCMESLQTYLPARYASLPDWLLNSIGALVGAALAIALEALGAIDHWSRFRNRWFAQDARGALVLLTLWPFALLFPATVPLGLGQVMERLETALALALSQTPFLEWLPVRDIELQPLVPLAELVCVALGLLLPCLLGYAVIRSLARRAVFLLVICALALGVSALSAALSWGPAQAWQWLSLPAQVGLVVGLLVCLLALPAPSRLCCALVFIAAVVMLSLLNQAPTGNYMAQTLQTWEQGRFIRFHGLGQWLGWIWPFAAAWYALGRLLQR